MKRHLLLLPVILGFMISVYATIESRSQEKWEYPRREMAFTVNSEKIDQDSVLVLFSTRGLLGLLKEYQVYCDTVTIDVIRTYSSTYDYRTGRTVYDSVKVKQTGMFMSVEGLMDWLENVKLK